MINLSNFNELVIKLQNTSSRIEKESLLSQYGTDSNKALFYWIFNPYIVTGISKKKSEKYRGKININKFSLFDLFEQDTTDYTDLTNMFNYFKDHNTGRDEDLIELEKFAQYNAPYQDLIYSIITKDLKLGIQSTTLNKVYGKGFIPEFNIMLAFKYFDDPDKFVPDNTEFILTTKLDGCVTGDTMVLTDIGYHRISDIVRNKLDVKVLSYNEKTKSFEFNKIIDYLEKPLDKEIYKLTFDDGRILKVTEDDYVLLKSGTWKKVSDLEVGDDIIDAADFEIFECNSSKCTFRTNNIYQLRSHIARCKYCKELRDDIISNLNIDELIDNYNLGYSLLDLSKKYNLNRNILTKLLKNKNVKIRGISEQASCDITRNKYINTCKILYGKSNTFQSPQTKLTLLNKYNTDNVRKVPSVIDKIKNTKLQRYGKLRLSPITLISNIEKQFEKFLIDNDIDYIPQYQVKVFNYKNGKSYYSDFYIPEKNLIIEVYGDYWHANPSKYDDNYFIYRFEGKMPAVEVRKIDAERLDHIKSKGFNTLIIWESEILDNSYINKFKEFYENL